MGDVIINDIVNLIHRWDRIKADIARGTQTLDYLRHTGNENSVVNVRAIQRVRCRI